MALGTTSFLLLCVMVAPSVEGCMKSNFVWILHSDCPFYTSLRFIIFKYEDMTLLFLFFSIRKVIPQRKG